MSDIHRIQLNWQGPHKFSDFMLAQEELRIEYSSAGVYLWTTYFPNGGDKIYYVGKATGRPSLFNRIQQHYALIVGGLYNVPAAFRLCKEEWIPDWRKYDTYTILTDIEKMKMLIEECFKYITACRVYLAKTSRDKVAILERNLLWDLRPCGTKWGTMTQPNPRLEIVHSNAKWLSDSIKSQIRDTCSFV